MQDSEHAVVSSRRGKSAEIGLEYYMAVANKKFNLSWNVTKMTQRHRFQVFHAAQASLRAHSNGRTIIPVEVGHGALLVSGEGAPGGCVNWSRP